MISNFFKKEVSEENINDKDKLIKITALLIHAAKVDENYSDNEKAIISNFLKSSNKDIDVNSIIKKAEENESNSNQILRYTQEIKNNTLEFRTKIVKVLWQIILSDNKSDMYESSLMRRICGLLYLPDKLSGKIKLEILEKRKL
tara:strand:- start:3198 stop:3629 length:432 start_codon:yes stop_codon:yes gene_type:complete